MKPEILQIAPMLPGVEAALGEAYVVHRYWEAADREALLAEAGPRIRGVATDGHYGIAPEILAALPELEIVASYGVGYDAIDTAACKARGVRATNTPDVLNDAVAELALGLMLGALPAHPAGGRPRARGQVADGRLRADRRADRRACRDPRARPHRQGDRPAAAGDEDARLLPRPARAALRALPFYPDLEAMARDVDWLVVIAPGSAATRGIVSREVLEALGPEGRARQRRARRRWSTRRRWSSSSSTGGSAARRSTSSPTSRGCRRRSSAMPNVVLSPHQGSATREDPGGHGRPRGAEPGGAFRRGSALTPIA